MWIHRVADNDASREVAGPNGNGGNGRFAMLMNWLKIIPPVACRIARERGNVGQKETVGEEGCETPENAG